ncbi:RHS repeat-associated core domain-containing protein [Paenibacillus sp. PsM32]|uniref:RHS repeat domain-containing protein n=1 Tax=Paenibacillus sp. PsM32 TaxID=3030536 RepID=UPI00263A9DCA|nr:RHS repeat-associated core domain-containing protein [Paenibacillus sp. PsM32]MDN4617494.1 RHS repeat-associated core domain-containing protein [Paenibacillus sp. PsM32]
MYKPLRMITAVILAVVFLTSSFSNSLTPSVFAATSSNRISGNTPSLPGVTIIKNNFREPEILPSSPIDLDKVIADVYQSKTSPSIIGKSKLGIQSFTNHENKEAIEDENWIKPYVAKSALTNKQVEELMLYGANERDIYELHILAQKKAIDPLSILKEKKLSKLTWNQWILNNAENNKSVTKDIYNSASSPYILKPSQDLKPGSNGMSFNVHQDTYISSIQPQEMSTMAVASSNGNDDQDQQKAAFYRGLIGQQQINQTQKEQYSDRQGSSEVIDPVTGALTLKYSALNYPGRDGLDLNLGLMYQSNQASVFGAATGNFYVWHTPDGGCPEIPILGYECPVRMESSDAGNDLWRVPNYLLERYKLGIGWSYQFPSVQSEGSYQYYHDGQGAVYQISLDATTGAEATTHLVNYQGRLMKFMKDNNASFNNGQSTSTSYLEHSDKKREYFDDRGRLLGIVDRFGNKITFEYNQDANTFSQITDTTGRKLVFNYQGTLGSDVDTSIMISVIDRNGNQKNKLEMKQQKQTFIYKKKETYSGSTLNTLSYINDNVSGQREYLENIVFNYKNAIEHFNYEAKEYGTKMGLNSDFLLQTVDYPRSKTNYEYNSETFRNLGVNGMIGKFPVMSRWDEYKQQNGGSGIRLNQMNYTHNGDYTGYPDYRDPDNLPEEYHYSSTATSQSNTSSNGMKVITTFNGKGQRLTTETIASNGDIKTDSVLAYHNEFKFTPLKVSSTMKDNFGSNTLFTENQYDNLGNVVATTMPLTEGQFNDVNFKRTHSTTFTYEPNYNLPSTRITYQQDNVQLIERYNYTNDGRPQSKIDSNDQETTYSYTGTSEQSGAISQMIEERSISSGMRTKKVTDYSNETGYSLPSKVSESFRSSTNGEVKQTENSYTYNVSNGLIAQQKDTEGKTTSYTYDVMDRVTSIQYPLITNADGEIYNMEDSYKYNNAFVETQDGSPAIAAQSAVTWRSYTQKSTGKETIMNQNIQLYNGFGNVVVQYTIDPRKERTVPLVQMVRYINDDQLRPVQQQRAVYEYANGGATLQVVNVPVTDISITYDPWGETKQTKDALGNITENDNQNSQYRKSLYVMDANGNRVNAVEQQMDQWGNLVLTSAYQNAAAKSDPIQEFYTYDIAGNVLTYTDPKGNKNNEGVTNSYRYDRLNRLNSLKNAMNETTSYQYDGNNQLIHISLKNDLGASTPIIYSKEFNESAMLLSKTDPADQKTQNKYDTLGRLQSNTDRNGSFTNYTYDERGQVLSYKKTMTSPKAQTMEYQYTFGKGNILTDQATMQTTGLPKIGQQTTVDSLKRPTRLYSYTSSNDYVGTINLKYNTWGQLENSQTNYQAGTSTIGTQQNYSYDAKQQLSSVVLNGTAKNIKYTYTPQGKVKSIVYPTMTNGKVLQTNYTYDALNRVLTTINSLDSVELSASLYDYDTNGNIVKATERRQGKSDVVTNYDYDGLNRLSSISQNGKIVSSYTYDLRGNRITLEDTRLTEERLLESLKNMNYSYNALNKLDTVDQNQTSTSFRYAPDGSRYQKQVITTDSKGVKTTTAYKYINDDNSKVIFEAKGTDYTEYIRGQENRVLLKKKPGSNTLSYYLYNGHGDVIGLLYDNGTVANSYEYDEFGNLTTEQEKTYNPFKYSGEYQDAETGLYHLNTRYYDPAIGRFLNEDTYEGQVNNPLSLNSYTYVHNNPLLYTDPNGTDVWLFHGTKVLGMGGTSETWTAGFINYLKTVFPGEDIHLADWSGGNSVEARAEGADKWTSRIKEWRDISRNENNPVRLIGHSHGGNVAIGVTNNLSRLKKGIYVTTLITIATPVRKEYQLQTGVIQHIHVYNNYDSIQINGGNIRTAFATNTRTYENDYTQNVEVKYSKTERSGSIAKHSAMHSNIDVWKQYIRPLLK